MYLVENFAATFFRLTASVYHGNRGKYFYFQCLQLILRHQIAVLIERWALPPELEVCDIIPGPVRARV